MKIKKLIILSIITLSFTACSKAPTPTYESEGYREYKLSVQKDMNFYTFKDAHKIIAEQTKNINKLSPIRANYEYDSFPSYNLKQPYLGGFKLNSSEFWIVESGRKYIQNSGKDRVWWEPKYPGAPGAKYEIYKDGKFYQDVTAIFSQPSCYGFDGFEGRINDIAWINNKLAFTYQVGECGTDTKTNVYIDGQGLNEKYGVEESKYAFEINGHEGFIARKNAKEYVYIDGKPITKEFNQIHPDFCCAMPEFFFDIYEDRIFFIGIRDSEYYLVAKIY